MKQISREAENIIASVTRILAFLWMLHKQGLAAIGLLSFFERHTWLYLVMFSLLVSLFPPLGFFIWAHSTWALYRKRY